MVEKGRWWEKVLLPFTQLLRRNWPRGQAHRIYTNALVGINAIHYLAPISITRMLLLHIIIIMNIKTIELFQEET